MKSIERSRIKQFVMALLSFAVLPQVQAKDPYPHENLPGSDVTAHWVHLSGHDGDNAKRRAAMVEGIHACIATMRQAGMPHQEVSDDEIPALVQPVEVDLYYTPNRVMRISRNIVNGYSRSNCSLNQLQNDDAVLLSSNGVCHINLNKKTAVGMCDAEQHAKAPPLRLKSMQQVESGYGSVTRTGETKMIAGLKCEVYTAKNPTDVTYCISRGGSFIAPGAASGTAMPGMLLDVYKDKFGVNLTATAAMLDMATSARVFAVPQGVIVKALPPMPGLGR